MKTILIVDDNKTIILTLKTKLESAGFKVITGTSFAETEQIIAERRKSIFAAILDLNLPDAPDGEIVDFVLSKRIPSVVLTGMFSEEIYQKMTEKNIIDYIMKNREEDFDYAVNLIKNISTYHKRKALIVDDSKLSLSILLKHTKLLQFDVITAKNGVEALKKIEHYGSQIDLVIVDYHMPEMDGFELLLEIRKKYKKDEIIVIGETAHNSQEVSAKFLKYGANGYLTKPFTKDEFNYTINNAFELVLEKRSNKEYHKLIDESIFSFNLDENLNFVSCSKAFRSITKYSLKDLFGKPAYAIFGKKLLDHIDLVARDGNWGGELKGRVKGGETFWLEGSLTMIKDNDGLISSYTGVFSDITNKKKLIENEKMLLSQTKFDAMSTVLSQISHHWRQPLTTVSLGFQNIVMESEELEECGKACFFNNGEMVKLVNKDLKILQNLSEKIEFFSKYLSQNFDLAGMTSDIFCREIKDLLEPILETSNIKLSFSNTLKEESFLVNKEIFQVIINLVQNSIDVLNTRKVENPEVNFSLERVRKKLVIKIKDNAGGVEEGSIDKLFEPYFSTKQNLNNTGLGLYISAVIIEKHLNGSIQAENCDDGLCITLKIPIEP